jgi:hypothetical protein
MKLPVYQSFQDTCENTHNNGFDLPLSINIKEDVFVFGAVPYVDASAFVKSAVP